MAREYNQTHLHVHRDEGPTYRDSLELGTAKTGVIKIYGDASRPEEFEARLRAMITLRERALALTQGAPGAIQG
jgi:hypothetical protein